MNMIANNPVTIENIDVSEHIFGPDIGLLKARQQQQNQALLLRTILKNLKN
jgi:hypothetical protein